MPNLKAYHYNGIEIPGGAPAIVSEDTFKVVERRMAKNKHASAKNKAEEKYILTTKLFCGKCHTMMVGDSAQKATAFPAHFCVSYLGSIHSRKLLFYTKKCAKFTLIHQNMFFVL